MGCGYPSWRLVIRRCPLPSATTVAGGLGHRWQFDIVDKQTTWFLGMPNRRFGKNLAIAVALGHNTFTAASEDCPR